MDLDLQRRFRFFLNYAGYVVGECASGALRLARAEQHAEANGWVIEWFYDELADLGDHEYWCREARHAKAMGSKPWCRHEVLFAHVENGSASLGCIIDPDKNYRRVIEAELFEEERNIDL